MIDAIRTGQVFGFAKAQVKSPPSLTEAYRERGFFYPIIATKIKLEPEFYASPPQDLPTDPVLTQVFNTQEPILVHSKVLEFYLELGCEVDIEFFVQYKGEKCFKQGSAFQNFVYKITRTLLQAVC